MDEKMESQDETSHGEPYEPPGGIDFGSVVELTMGAHGVFPDGNLFVNLAVR